jgi:hypothetical protein
MGIQYQLFTRSDLPPADVLKQLFKVQDTDLIFTQGKPYVVVTMPGFVANAMPVDTGEWLPVHQLDIFPSTDVLCRKEDYLKVEGAEDPVFVIFRAVLDWIASTQTDSAFIANGEEVLLVYKGGRLVLNKETGFWTDPEFLGLVKLPYKMESFPIL